MNICPALGAQEDPELQYAFPSEVNHCHKAEPVGQVSLVYQSSMCLSENHRRCPVYRGRLSGPLPESFRANGHTSGGLEMRKILLWAGLMLFALLGLGFNIAFPNLADAVLSNSDALETVPIQTGLLADPEDTAGPTRTHTPTPTLPVLDGETSTQSAERTARAERTRNAAGSAAALATTSAASPEASTSSPATELSVDATPTAPPLTATLNPPGSPTPAPCRPPAGWVAYTVRAGDSLFYLASVTNVSVQAIKTANCLPSNVIRTSQVLYLPTFPPIPQPTPVPTATMPVARATDDLPTREP